ncbi:hypothetical protein PPYR_10197 [Photinus pyralis]|uniref:folate gamma-glutamyl hydrolase n=1 Tax=Photinus pyralis TaxID=7054 RepID=A0A5N4AFR7_PHOPY|nr:gamma-glutamyl hydrolase-like [Photinus pyralis]KAB0796136.1 hypothetical protein PPYR_10197 [Photinus pyralis]
MTPIYILNMKLIIAVLCALLSFCACTEVPIIGILSQETYSVKHLFPDEDYHSFIAASYVKLLESAGARVVPIWIGQDEEYYRKVVECTNGMLFPGGATYFNQSCGYAEAGQMIYDVALERNRNGDYYPIWGICLGMELLIEVANGLGQREVREACLSKKVSLPLEFRKDIQSSRTFGSAPKEVIKILLNENVTYNYHQFCVTEKGLKEFGLEKDWVILSTNRDINGLEFISSYESKHYPFYGVQFHPEKNMFEFKDSLNIPHSKNAVVVSQYLANEFVEETRRNSHSFNDWESEQKSLIYNYPAQFTGIKNSSYEQLYMFKKSDYKIFF